MSARRWLVLGLGNPLAGADGFGPAVIGDGKYRHVARLPFNEVFKVDFTDLTLAVPNLPPAWDKSTGAGVVVAV